MKALTCAAARRRLGALYDRELSVAEQIAVQAHLDWCDACALALVELQAVGSVVRAAAIGRDVLTHEEATAFTAALVGRRNAERDSSLLARLQGMFDDMHLVYAGVGATVATAVCVVIMLTMMRFAPTGRPDTSPTASLNALIALAADPGSSANAISIDAASQARGSARFQAASETAQEDVVFWIEAAVTRDGRLISLDRLRTTGRKATREQAALIEELMKSVARARIEPGAETAPATTDGIVWLVTSTTVRATKAIASDLPLPPMSKKKPGHLLDAHASTV
jgi:hypothetical protein